MENPEILECFSAIERTAAKLLDVGCDDLALALGSTPGQVLDGKTGVVIRGPSRMHKRAEAARKSKACK